MLDRSSDVADSVTIPELSENVSYARAGDGSARWQRQACTPLGSNDGKEEVVFSGETLPAPVLSVPSGFYEGDIDVRIFSSGTGWKIYYTLDGSEPDETDFLYDGDIRVTDVSGADNVYAARTDISAAVYFDAGFSVPGEPVDKAAVIRARAFDGAGGKSPVVTGVYFIGYDKKEQYNDMAVVSLVTDPANLFDYDNGIYVLGRTYDESEENRNWDGQWQFLNANYRRGGRQTERPVHIDYFEGAQKRLMLSQEAGMRVKGNFSRGLVQKSLNLYARKEYDGSSDFGYSFFEDGRYHNSVTLFCGGNDVKGKLMDYLAHIFAADLRFDTMKFVPCAVFLDGEYWGFYYLTEKYDAGYLEQYYGLDKADIVMIKDKKLNYGTREDYDGYDDDMRFIRNEDMTVEENYEKFCELFDRDSYIDYYAFAICIGREGDWPGNNWALWKARTGSEHRRWRWMMYDLNFWCMQNPDFDSFAYLYEQDEAFANLMRNDEFRAMLLARVWELTEGILHESGTVPVLEDAAAHHRLQMQAYYDRFYDGVYTLETYDGEVSVLRNFLQNRRSYLEQYIQAYQ